MSTHNPYIKWSPLMMEMLIHYHCHVDDYPAIEFPAQQAALKYFIAVDCMYINSHNKIALSAKGKAVLSNILRSAPLAPQKYS